MFVGYIIPRKSAQVPRGNPVARATPLNQHSVSQVRVKIWKTTTPRAHPAVWDKRPPSRLTARTAGRCKAVGINHMEPKANRRSDDICAPKPSVDVSHCYAHLQPIQIGQKSSEVNGNFAQAMRFQTTHRPHTLMKCCTKLLGYIFCLVQQVSWTFELVLKSLLTDETSLLQARQ